MTAGVWIRTRRRLGRGALGASLAYLALTALGFVFSIPLLWVVTTSFKGQGNIFTHPILYN